ncbi:MAG TPA: DUF6152 family protein [Gammaproteobacteria bacterium]|nr:DUF6152 family protein [Gammaproteobacteria bacterium]
MRSLSITAVSLTAIGSIYAAGAALAHHSFAAQFDRDKPVSLTGTVTEMRWSNPHAWIYIDVEDADGQVVNWALETRAANNLIRLGWRPQDLPVGAMLVVDAFQARNGTPTASVETVTFADGRSLFVGSPEQSAQP